MTDPLATPDALAHLERRERTARTLARLRAMTPAQRRREALDAETDPTRLLRDRAALADVGLLSDDMAADYDARIKALGGRR